jgi:sugar lactone lactonase YvrE
VRWRKYAILPGLLAVAVIAGAAADWEAEGFKTPESAITDPSTGNIYVSNINGPPTAKDDNGFIVRLSPDGAKVDLGFIDGGNPAYTLNAPKGMAIYGGLLYVTDITHVRAFRLSDGSIAATIDLTPLGAAFLNDMVVDGEGNLYVSDTAANAIFLIRAGAGNEARLFIQHDGLQGPNGVMLNPQTGSLIVVSWGAGRLMEVTPDGVQQLEVRGTFKNLDGIDYDADGNIYFSDFTAGVVYRLEPGGEVAPLVEGLKNPADISVDKNSGRILIPEFSGNRLKSRSLER